MFRPAARPAPQRAPDGAAELAIAALVAGFVGVGALLWAAGETAGWISTGHWPRLGLAASTVAAIRLARNLGNPGAAWSPAVAAQFGSAPVFWALVAAEVAMLAVVAVVAARLLQGRATDIRRRARRPGMASACELRRELSVATRRRRAGQVRPSLERRANRGPR